MKGRRKGEEEKSGIWPYSCLVTPFVVLGQWFSFATVPTWPCHLARVSQGPLQGF
jgi:hypothetical protein